MVELCESARRGLAGALHEAGEDVRLRMGGVRGSSGSEFLGAARHDLLESKNHFSARRPAG